ncbi:cryptochrome/photolyase family protein [Thioclava sp. GXIMD4215]|uniref:cryptochrome/photolyase family protein n=1 Tax=Thioclava sp. GXIMD4215 TaxID=3131928 RepID=UPI003252E0F4
MGLKPVILWLRRDFRLHDHPAMVAAEKTGAPVICVFIHDEIVAGTGAAAKWRWGEAIASFAARLEEIGSRLILRKGAALEVLQGLVQETGATQVHWSRAYDPASIARDRAVKAALRESGIGAHSHKGHLMFEPWDVATGKGEPYKVYTPYWNAVKGRGVDTPCDTVRALAAPETWPDSEALASWQMGAQMRRGGPVLAEHACIGEASAQGRMASFFGNKIDDYKTARDQVDQKGTSNLSENLTYGEISPRSLWHSGWARMEAGSAGAETFLKELVWREFAWHLLYHFPKLDHENWRAEWNGFGWRRDNNDAEAWRRGRTGEPFVDAAMREMFVTGQMHNRARMIVASYLTKHLMTDWRVGLRWFEDCLTDWDPASNAMGWQWVAGCGPDAAPYFRVFNPETQAQKFDPDGRYRRAWIAEGQPQPGKTALQYFDAIPKSWRMSADDRYPPRLVDLKEGREKALAAYERHKKG